MQSARIRLPGAVQPTQNGDLDGDQGLRHGDPQLYPREQPSTSEGDPRETPQVGAEDGEAMHDRHQAPADEEVRVPADPRRAPGGSTDHQVHVGQGRGSELCAPHSVQ